MATAKEALIARGVDPQSIQQEHFTPHTPITTGLSHATVTLANSGRSFVWTPEQPSILAAAEAAGVRLAAGCRAGPGDSGFHLSPNVNLLTPACSFPFARIYDSAACPTGTAIRCGLHYALAPTNLRARRPEVAGHVSRPGYHPCTRQTW